MPSSKLTCPHCGHDGTLETSKPPLQSYGFNYLADGTVCREVRGYDESGRLRLSGDFKCEGPQAANARIECRSCWQTFAAPEGLLWAEMADQPAAVAGSLAADAGEQTKAAAESIAHNLVLIVRHGMQQSEQANAGEVARLEATIAHLAEEVPGLRAELAGVRGEAMAGQQQLLARVTLAEAAVRAQAEIQPKMREGLGVLRTLQEDCLRKLEEQAAAVADQKQTAAETSALCAQLQEEQQALRQRLDAQAEVIRSLHATAQEHTSRREELRAAVQRLEEISGALDQVNPLPKDL